jgi:ATP synthase F1 delta subunit
MHSIVEILKLKLNASDIKLFSAIEKNLLGGFEIKIGDNVLDFSIKGQLKKLAEQLEITL